MTQGLGAGGAGRLATALGYRPEIDGLRAVAVVPVVLFHAGFSVFSGGYVGVDVFFVISGYLVTGILLGDIDAGRFSIARFYERRARRILPALFLVLACCLPFAWATMLPDELARFGKSLVAVLGFSSNVIFWLEQGYFTDVSELKPLLHTWSLAVEEQFYILFPLALFLMRRASRRTLGLAIAAGALASFALCEIAAYRYELANFYLAPTRAWELLGGSFCACLGQQQARRGAGALAWLGLALILAAIFLLDAHVPFPSHWALLPVAGTMLLVLFARAESGAGRLLAMKPFVGIGLVSYSLYLWHQPLFAFARLSTPGLVPQTTLLALAALALALSVLSWRFVEQPLRRRSGLGEARRALPLAIVVAVLLAAAGAVMWRSDGLPGRFVPSRDPAIVALADAARSPRILRGDCKGDIDSFTHPCRFAGHADPARRIAVYGDSHAEALLPAFEKLALQRGLELHYAALGGCPPLLGGYVLNGNDVTEACPELAHNELAHARAAGIDTVFLVGRWTLYASGEPFDLPGRYLLADRPHPFFWNRSDSARVLGRLLERTVDAYRAIGIRVIVVDQVPTQLLRLNRVTGWLTLRPPAEGLEATIRETSITIAQFAQQRAASEPAMARQRSHGIAVVRLEEAFRSGDRYLWGRPGQGWYRDANHVSTAGALRLVDPIAASLDNAPR